jgi:tetratricopeptide (TPR) repeat protein
MKYSLIAAAVLSSAALWAQDLPQMSPKTTFEQRIGLTDAKVTYGRPSARERDIFSEIVPPGEHWRLGANTKTLLTLSSEVNFSSGALPAGTYSLSLFPNDGEWVLVINKDLEGWGIYEYNEKSDALRVSAPVEFGSMKTESLLLAWDNIQTNSADLIVSWGDRMARFPMKVPTERLAKENIAKALADPNAEWTVYRNAARYARENKMPEAESWAKTAVKMKSDNWGTHYLLAQILEENGKKSEALKAAQNSLEAGLADGKKMKKAFANESDVQALISRLK